MNDKYFIDTNILVCSFGDNLKKREISDTLISQLLLNGTGVISFQVIQEFSNAALRKFKVPFSGAELQAYCATTLCPLCQIYPSFEWLDRALSVNKKQKISYFDALVVSAAIFADCKYLFTEDLNDGQKIEKVTIVNPYANPNIVLKVVEINSQRARN